MAGCGRACNLRQVCLNPIAIVQGHRTLARLFLSAFLHGDDLHLYYNMVSLVWKGAQLEGSMGSARFAAMVCFLLAASHILVVASAFAAADVLGYPGLLNQCAVGFSAVLFGMKVCDGERVCEGVCVSLRSYRCGCACVIMNVLLL
jgi:rhomboid domain-containing protein 1